MNTNAIIVVEALNLKSNRRRLYRSNSLFDKGMVISVDYRCTDGSETALAIVTGAADVNDPRLNGVPPTHSIRAYYTGPNPVSYDAVELGDDAPKQDDVQTGEDTEKPDVDLTEFKDEEEDDGE